MQTIKSIGISGCRTGVTATADAFQQGQKICFKQMSKLLLLITWGLIVNCKLFSQNLVSNWSFEYFSLCPIGQNELYKAQPWFNPTTGTPDYFNACSNGMHVPNNGLCFQFAKSGVAFGGFITWTSGASNVREYLEVELIDSLEPGNTYYISFYVSLIETVKYSVSNIGMYISDTAVYLTSNTNFPFVPQIENPAGNFLTDTLNWMQISGTYLAHGGEKFITIGNFRDDANTDTLNVNPSQYAYSYYLVDDVTVIDADSVQGLHEQSNFNFNIYPNPATGFLNIKTKTNKPLTFKISNLLGQEKVRAKITGDAKVDVGSIASGVYVYRVYEGDKVLKVGKLMKE